MLFDSSVAGRHLMLERSKSPPCQDMALRAPLLSEGEEEWTTSIRGRAHPSRSSWLKTTIALLLVGALTLTAVYITSQGKESLSLKPKRIWLRAVEDNTAGLGSVVHQLRFSAALARAVDARLVVPTTYAANHHYEVASYLNGHPSLQMNISRVCVLSAILKQQQTSHETLVQVMKDWCTTGAIPPQLSALQPCTVIIDDRPWEYERHFAFCTVDWLDSILQ